MTREEMATAMERVRDAAFEAGAVVSLGATPIKAASEYVNAHMVTLGDMVMLLFVRLEAAEKCIAAAEDLREFIAVREPTPPAEVYIYDAARAAWEATK